MTFARKLGAGFAAVVLVAALLVAVTVGALTTAAASRARLEAAPTEDLVALVQLRSTFDRVVARARVYLRTGDEASRGRAEEALVEAEAQLEELRGRVASDSGRRLLAGVAQAEASLRGSFVKLVELRGTGADGYEVAVRTDAEFDPRVIELFRSVDALGRHKGRLLQQAKREALVQASRARRAVLFAAIGGLGLAGVLAYLLTHTFARLHRETEDAVRARDEFLSVASHELRTPLTALKLTVDHHLRVIEEDRIELPAVAREMLLGVRKQTQRLTRLVLQLLDVSRIQAGRLHLEREPVDLAALVRQVVAADAATFEHAGCDVRVRSLAALVGSWDRLRLEQVIGNLLSNAVKYGAGSPIEVDLDEVGGRARLRVTDHGIGIDEADQARIFERFERGAAGRAGFIGFGLGLWIARQIAEAHGGTIGVRSRRGEGAAFAVELPLAPPGAPSPTVAEPAPAAAAGSRPSSPAAGVGGPSWRGA